MKRIFWLAFFAFSLLSCQPQTNPNTITVLDGGKIHYLQTEDRLPLLIFTGANLPYATADRVFFNGQTVPVDQPLPKAQTSLLQIRHAVPLTLVTPQGQQVIQTVAFTVGQALQDAGLQIYAADELDPPLDTPITGPLTITWHPSRELTVTTSSGTSQIRSTANTVGAALAEAGIPLQNLDYSQPSESDPLPVDGQIRVVRVSESVQLVQKSVPFESDFIASADVELDQQQILQPGEPGLAVSRVRIRYEDGQEISRQIETETIVRPPQTRVVGYGTKVVVRKTTVGGVEIEYWRTAQVYVTSYSPCRSGVTGQCFSGTASGLPVKKGVIATKRTWYYAMQGQRLYVPGYGIGVIADLGGGFPDGRAWIDLGYSDSDYQPWHDWVTVYFLTPVPASFPFNLE